MTLATLTDVLKPAMAGGYAVAGVVVQGWEDARAYVDAAEAENAPIILQAGPGARAHMPVQVFGAMFRALAERASVPVVAHLDHGANLAECRAAVDCGFTSVMFDGSRLSLAENIDQTAQIAAMAHAAGVSVEAELGFVGYAEGATSRGTDPAEATVFADQSGADALAVAIGNLHLMQSGQAAIDWDLLTALQSACPLPLVLHGGSGIGAADRARLVKCHVSKINIGTELRMTFGTALRGVLSDPTLFDRNVILSQTMPALTAAARTAIRSLRPV
jgi:fructose-bisphosphate aldolase, class II